jgi:manganese/zinc/iron transport system permease protein
MLWLSGLFGALSGMLGAGFSALMANLPAGAVIVLTASVIFIFSMTFGSARGLLKLFAERSHLRKRIMQENLLRDLYEWLECVHDTASAGTAIEGPYENGPTLADLLAQRSWISRKLQRTIRRLKAANELIVGDDQRIALTDQGLQAAKEVVRKHRLWEAYLISHADVATGMVDLSADRIEHVLDEEIIRSLEKLFPEISPKELPQSPHLLKSMQGAV